MQPPNHVRDTDESQREPKGMPEILRTCIFHLVRDLSKTWQTLLPSRALIDTTEILKVDSTCKMIA